MANLSATRAGGSPPKVDAKGQFTAAPNTMPTIILLFIVAAISLLLCQQIATGWIALGERANISRADYNGIEIAAIIGTAIWGVLALATALAFARRRVTTMRTIIAERLPMTRGGALFAFGFLFMVGALSLLISEQVATGWIALGERANISRRDLNWIEWLTIIGGALWGLVMLRTAFSLWVHDKRGWTWAQWVTLITAVIGLSLAVSGMFDTRAFVNVPIMTWLPDLQLLILPGILLFVSSLAAYRYLALDTETAADQALRNQLAKIPGAGAIIGFIAIFIFFSLATDQFLEPRSLAGALTTNVTRGVVAIGITILMISGEFDLSVGSQLGATGLIFLLCMTEGILGLPPFPVIPSMLVAFVFAALLGLINGFILIRTGIPSFIVTLGTLLAFNALPLVIVAEGRILRYADYRLPPPSVPISKWVMVVGASLLIFVTLYLAYRVVPRLWRALREKIAGYRDDPNDLRDFWLVVAGVRLVVTIAMSALVVFLLGAAVSYYLGVEPTVIDVDFFELMNGQLWFLPVDVNLRSSVIWWFLLVLIFQFILTQTPYGGYSFAVGGNPGAARAQGISVNRVKVTNFVICSLFVAFAAIMDVSRVQNVDSTRGDGLELEVIAASVIGGTLLTGGYGSIIGALLGVFIFGMLRTGLVLIGLNPRIFNGVIGVIIIVAVVINTGFGRQRK
jgi:ribose/xylose/arabinose/galactoside ABC-type transport system permease subunit